MIRKIRHFKTIILFLILFPEIAFSQNSDQYTFFSLGFDGGYFFPVGHWKTHRYAAGVDQFQGDFKIGLELETKITRIGIGIIAGYSRLDLSQWEEYAQRRGDIISASANIYDLGLLFKYYFIAQKPSLASIDLGFNYFFPQGHETFSAYSYDYSFFNSNFGFMIGIGVKHLLSDNLALSLNIRGMLSIEGVKYPDGLTYDIMGLPITIGIRYIF